MSLAAVNHICVIHEATVVKSLKVKRLLRKCKYKLMNPKQQTHHLKTESNLRHWGGGGLNAFHWCQICALDVDSVVVKKTKIVSFQENRLAQIHHARLRAGCSTLCLHLYYENIIENPLCNCGEIEDPFHFFVECNQYNLIRRDMLTCKSVICNPYLNILLHGNEGLSGEQNL